MEVFSGCVRIVLFMSVSNVFCLAFMGKMLGWKGGFFWAYVGLLQKCLLINCLMGQILIPYVTRNDGTILWKKEEGYGVALRMREGRK